MSSLRRIISLLVVLFSALAIASCGGDQRSVEHAKVSAGDMPEGSDWSGVYYSQTYGHLHLVEQGGTGSGKWRTVNGDAWGELAGEVNGDLLRFEWTEHKIGMVGPTATTKGRGYFKYVASTNGIDPDEIKGEWGLGNKEFGQPWTATKQPRMKPDPDSVQPDELERRGQGGGWDDEGGRKAPSEGDKAFGTGGGDEPEKESGSDEPPPATGPESDY